MVLGLFKKKLKYRPPRIYLSEKDPVFYEIAEFRYAVSNLSFNGVALKKDVLRDGEIQLSQHLSGKFFLGERGFDLPLQVVREDRKLFGCQMKLISSEFRHALEDYFKNEFSGKKMTEVNSLLLEKDPEGQPRLFLFSDQCELFFIENETGKIIRFYLSFFGNYIEKKSDGSLHFASFEGGEPVKEGTVRSVSQVLGKAKKSKEELATEAKKLLLQMDGLKAEQKQELIGFLSIY